MNSQKNSGPLKMHRFNRLRRLTKPEVGGASRRTTKSKRSCQRPDRSSDPAETYSGAEPLI